VVSDPLARANPPPQVLPQHTFVLSGEGPSGPCWQVMFVLDSGWPVRCGLLAREHVQPEPEDQP